jgi:hypothetical protein
MIGNNDVFASVTHERVAREGDRIAPERSILVPKLFFWGFRPFQEIMKIAP